MEKSKNAGITPPMLLKWREEKIPTTLQLELI
jgi:hypothetical protein